MEVKPMKKRMISFLVITILVLSVLSVPMTAFASEDFVAGFNQLDYAGRVIGTNVKTVYVDKGNLEVKMSDPNHTREIFMKKQGASNYYATVRANDGKATFRLWSDIPEGIYEFYCKIVTLPNGVIPGTTRIKWSSQTVNVRRSSAGAAPEVAVSSVKLNRTSYSMDINKKMQLSATVSPSSATDKTVTWKTSNSAIASVDSNGKVTAKKQGKATITATTSNGKTAKCVVTVRKAATSIKLDKTSMSINKGKTGQLKVSSFSPTTTYPNTITWKSNNEKVATVDKNGKVKGIKAGTATIYAKTWNGVFAKCKVTVK